MFKRITSTLVSLLLVFAALSATAQSGTKAKEDVTIGLSTAAVATAFIMSLYYGVADEAEVEGVRLIALDAGGYENVSQQIQQIQDLIQRRVDVIIVNVTNAEAIAPAVEMAVASGIPVVGLSSLPATDQLAVKVGADHYGMGRLQAQCLAAQLEPDAEVAIMPGPPGVNWAMERTQGFKDVLAEEYPEIRIVAEVNSNSDRNNGLKIMEDWLQAFPDLAGIATVVDDLGAGAADAIAAANKTGDILISSSNLSAIGYQYLQDGKIDCMSAQQGVLQGRVALQSAVAIALGEELEETNYVTDALLIEPSELEGFDLSTISAPAGYKP